MRDMPPPRIAAQAIPSPAFTICAVPPLPVNAFRHLAMALDHAVMRKGFSRPLTYPPLALV
jgi:hypothetical protein